MANKEEEKNEILGKRVNNTMLVDSPSKRQQLDERTSLSSHLPKVNVSFISLLLDKEIWNNFGDFDFGPQVKDLGLLEYRKMFVDAKGGKYLGQW